MPPKKNRGARGGGSGFLGGGGFLSNLNAAASSLGLEDDTPSDDSPPMNPLINHPWPDPFARQSRANLAPGPPASSQGATPQPSGNSTSNGPSSQPPPHCPDLSPLTPSSSSGQQADTAVEITPDNSKVHPSAGNGPTPVAWEYDLAFMVLRNLESRNLKSARLVCKRWDVLCSAIMDFPATRRLDELLEILGPVKRDQDSQEVFMLDFDVYDIPPEKLNAFIASARSVRKLDLDFTKGNSAESIPTIAPEVFMALSVVKNKLSHDQSLFGNLKELVISQYLFPICQYAFTSVLFPPSIQTLTISNLGRVSIQTVFGYLSTIAPHIGEVRLFGDADTVKKFKSFTASKLEAVQGIRRLECRGLTNEWGFLQALSGGCPNLERLHVEYGSYSESSESKWRNVKFSSLQSLTLLHVPDAQVGNMVSFFQKATFNCIRSLEVSFQGDVSLDARELFLSNLSSTRGGLESLSISSTNNDLFWRGKHFQAIMRLKNLQHLTLKGSFVVGDRWFALLCTGLPKLKSLILEGTRSDITVSALRWCNREIHHPLTNLTMLVDGSIFQGQPSIMELPRNLGSLSLNLFNLRQELIPQLAATISSACPAIATVTFTGSPTEAVSSLESAFHTLHSWRRESEMRTVEAMRLIKEELKELREMYQQVVNERDMVMRERKSLEVLVGSVCSDESAEVL